jgi:hypothetical protein
VTNKLYRNSNTQNAKYRYLGKTDVLHRFRYPTTVPKPELDCCQITVENGTAQILLDIAIIEVVAKEVIPDQRKYVDHNRHQEKCQSQLFEIARNSPHHVFEHFVSIHQIQQMETIQYLALNHSHYRNNYVEEHINKLRVRTQEYERLYVVKDIPVKASECVLPSWKEVIAIRAFRPEKVLQLLRCILSRIAIHLLDLIFYLLIDFQLTLLHLCRPLSSQNDRSVYHKPKCQH